MALQAKHAYREPTCGLCRCNYTETCRDIQTTAGSAGSYTFVPFTLDPYHTIEALVILSQQSLLSRT